MTHTCRTTLARSVAVAAVMVAVGCGGSDATPNPGLEVPKSTTTPDDVKAGRGGLAKSPGKK